MNSTHREFVMYLMRDCKQVSLLFTNVEGWKVPDTTKDPYVTSLHIGTEGGSTIAHSVVSRFIFL